MEKRGKEKMNKAIAEWKKKYGRDIWTQTYTGKVVSLINPAMDDIDIGDISHALSLICRFNGHTIKFYSVAEHSVRVSKILPPDLALWGLMHDASEAYLTDIPRPVKTVIGKIYKQMECKFMKVICEKFGLQWPEPPLVKACDNILLVTERRDLIREQEQDWHMSERPLEERIKPRTPIQAEKEFLRAYEFLKF